MPADTPTASPTELRAVRRSLTAANDAKVLQVVAMVDDMADRGPADGLIQPLRGRLAQLRPARKLRLERLLFTPLDPLIVPARDWRPQDPTIPRNAVTPIAATVRIALGRDIRPIGALIAGKTTLDTDAAMQAGELLWPIAARVLAMAPLPLGWVEAGLKPVTYEPLARSVAAVLGRLPILMPLFQDASGGMIAPREDAIELIVAGLAGEPHLTQAMVIGLLMTRLPRVGPLLQRIESSSRSQQERVMLRRASDQAADVLLERLERDGGAESQIVNASLADAGVETRRLVMLLDELESRSGSQERRSRLKILRARLDASCRARFIGGLNEELLGPLQNLVTAVDRPMQMQLETAARQLRSLETTARQIGNAMVYDGLLRQATTTVRSVDPGALSVLRAARLVEILAGSEAAMALLEEAQ
jgi:hypothetical protein